MSENTLPATPETFAGADWDRIEPEYDALERRSETDTAWVRDWSALEDLIEEAMAAAYVGYTTDTENEERERLHLRWATEIEPRLEERRTRLARRLVDSGWSEPGMEPALNAFRNQISLFREENLPLSAEVAGLTSAYQKRVGAMQVEWDGETLTIPRVMAKLGEPDRDVRERAYRAYLSPYVAQRAELAALFDELLGLRRRIAANAGLPSYRDYAHQEKNRFDYTPDDCLRFHEAVEKAVVPAAGRVLRRRQEKMGLETLRPWDVEGASDPLGRPPLTPFRDASELIAGSGRIFQRVDPLLGGRFQKMVAKQLLDLESRHGKAPGGYCIHLPHRGLPFIFANSVGTQQDVETLLHESGHSFHVFEAAALPYHWQRDYGSEIAEVASMSMELLSNPYLASAEGGFYTEEDAHRAREEHLERILLFFGHCASVDAFQQWIYTHPEGGDADARDRRWIELRSRFEPAIDFSGLDRERAARWYKQLHIFELPFYYIEYGLAQLGALQVWRNSRRDRGAAIAAYRRALALGSTKPLDELFAAAGARLVFDADGMAELVDVVEEELARLRG
ncbi:MAG TPA: M3 family oligoendopeptidase [Candidatus Dormibacteraeota bacterium]|jgi:oligoendopeptidase F|nr:M3 family oligoendopeptidase [Candidatus Dormibacteraeota bacterium]